MGDIGQSSPCEFVDPEGTCTTRTCWLTAVFGHDKPQHYSLKVFPLTTSTQLNLRRNVARSFEPVTQLQKGDMGTGWFLQKSHHPLDVWNLVNHGDSFTYQLVQDLFQQTGMSCVFPCCRRKHLSGSWIAKTCQNHRFDLFAPKWNLGGSRSSSIYWQLGWCFEGNVVAWNIRRSSNGHHFSSRW